MHITIKLKLFLRHWHFWGSAQWVVGSWMATSYQYTLCNNPEERRPQLLRSGKVKSCKSSYLKITVGRDWNGFIQFRKRKFGVGLWARARIFGLYKLQGVPWMAKKLLAFQGLFSVMLITYLFVHYLFIQSFIHLVRWSFIQSLSHLVIHLFIQSFTHSDIRSVVQ